MQDHELVQTRLVEVHHFGRVVEPLQLLTTREGIGGESLILHALGRNVLVGKKQQYNGRPRGERVVVGDFLRSLMWEALRPAARYTVHLHHRYHDWTAQEAFPLASLALTQKDGSRPV